MGYLNLLDILALLVLAVSVVASISKGLLVELLSTASVIAGLFLAIVFYPDLALVLTAAHLFSGQLVNNLIAFLSIFIVTVIFGSILGTVMARVLEKLHIRWVDRILGGLFGLLRGYLINSVIFLALTAFPVKKCLLANSHLADFFLAGARLLVIFIPEDLKLKFLESCDWFR